MQRYCDAMIKFVWTSSLDRCRYGILVSNIMLTSKALYDCIADEDTRDATLSSITYFEIDDIRDPRVKAKFEAEAQYAREYLESSYYAK